MVSVIFRPVQGGGGGGDGELILKTMLLRNKYQLVVVFSIVLRTKVPTEQLLLRPCSPPLKGHKGWKCKWPIFVEASFNMISSVGNLCEVCLQRVSEKSI